MKKYAVLFAGCLNDKGNKLRYNNDLGYMYTVLQKLGYDEIVILFTDGRQVTYNGSNIGTKAATKQNLQNEIARIKILF